MLEPASAAFHPPISEGPPATEGVSEPSEGRPPGAAAGASDAADWRAAADLLEREAAALGTDPAAARLLHEAGRIHEERLGDVAGALERYRAAYAVDRLFAPNLEAAQRAARAAGDVELECELLLAGAHAARDPHDAADLALARAAALASLGRGEAAAEATRAALDADGASVAAAACEAALAAGGGRLEELSRAWERCAERAGTGPASAAWLLAASSLEDERLGQPERAAALALRAFALDPASPAVRAAARRLAPAAADRAAVLAADARAASSPREAALALCALARLEHDAARPEQAAEAVGQARAAAGDDPVALDALARLHEARGEWERLAEVLRARAAHPAEGDRAALVAGNLRLAEVCAAELDDPGEAVAGYRAVLALEPGHRGALAALGRLHARAGEWDLVYEVCLAERDAAPDPRERAHRCVKAAGVLEERLGRPGEAVAHYEEALALEPQLVAAHAALERIYERDGRHTELAALLEHDLSSTQERTEAVGLLFRLARLREDRLQDPEGAAGAYERLLALAPEDVVALRALAALHVQAGRHAAAVALLERLAALAADPRRRVALLQRAAELQEEGQGDPAAAIATHQRVLAIHPAHEPSLRGLGRLYAAAGRWVELVAMSRAEAEVAPSPEAAAALLFRAGEILHDRIGKDDDAVAVWREVLTLSPAHPGALAALARVYRARGEWDDLVEVLRADAAARGASGGAAALLCEAAELCETCLGDPARAADVHEEVLRASPAFGPSLSALDRLLRRLGRHGDLARVLGDAAGALHGAERAAALVAAARLRAGPLGDGPGADALCRTALEASPGDAGALLLRAALAAAAGDPAPVADAHRGLAGALADRRAAAGLLGAAALARRGAPGEGAAALAAAEAAPCHPVAAPLAEAHLRAAGDGAARARHFEARRDGEAEPAARALWALRAGEAWDGAGEAGRAVAAYRESLALVPDALPALQALRRAHARAGEWGEVRATLRVEGASLRDPSLAAAAFAEAAAVGLERLGDAEGAASDLRRALERDPAHPDAAPRLAELLQRSGRDADLCELRELCARTEADPDRAAEAWVGAARFALAPLGDRLRALGDLDRALALRPAAPQAVVLRGRLLADGGRPLDAARELTACLGAGGEPAALAPVHLELAGLYEGPLADPTRALSHLYAAVDAAPDDAAALARLARAHRERRNWPAAADALRRLVALPSLEPEALAPHLVALAEVRAGGFGDAAGALELCERALAVAPGDAAASAVASRLRANGRDAAGVFAALAAAAEAAPDGPSRARAHVRSARILAGSLGEPARAIEELRRALAAAPDCVEARRDLAALYEASDPAAAIEEHRHLLAADPARAESWRAIYRLSVRTEARDRAFVAAGVLRFLGLSDPAGDGAYLAENALRAPGGTAQVLAPGEWRALRHPADRGPLSDLLALVGHALGELAVAPGAAREKLRGAQPFAGVAAEICATLGVEQPVLRPGVGAEVRAEPADPPALRIGPDFARRHAVAQQRFLLGRAAARLRTRSALAAQLGPAQLGETLAAVVRVANPAYVGLGVPGDALAKAVARALSRKVKKALDEHAAALERAGALDVVAWHAALAATSDRAGLLVAADVPAALGLALGAGGEAAGGPEEIAAAVRQRRPLGELLAFAASEEHLRLRQRLGLAIG